MSAPSTANPRLTKPSKKDASVLGSECTDLDGMGTGRSTSGICSMSLSMARCRTS